MRAKILLSRENATEWDGTDDTCGWKFPLACVLQCHFSDSLTVYVLRSVDDFYYPGNGPIEILFNIQRWKVYLTISDHKTLNMTYKIQFPSKKKNRVWHLLLWDILRSYKLVLIRTLMVREIFFICCPVIRRENVFKIGRDLFIIEIKFFKL